MSTTPKETLIKTQTTPENTDEVLSVPHKQTLDILSMPFPPGFTNPVLGESKNIKYKGSKKPSPTAEAREGYIQPRSRSSSLDKIKVQTIPARVSSRISKLK